MSDSVRPHRQQPTRLPRPWDSPGKKTGVGTVLYTASVRAASSRLPQASIISDQQYLFPLDSDTPTVSPAQYSHGRSLPFKVGRQAEGFVIASQLDGYSYINRILNRYIFTIYQKF